LARGIGRLSLTSGCYWHGLQSGRARLRAVSEYGRAAEPRDVRALRRGRVLLAMNLKAGRIATEFAVVVVGVLVALSADRWVQSLDDRASEVFYLERLTADLRADSATLVDAITVATTRGETAVSILELSADSSAPVADPEAFLAAFQRVGWFNEVDYATSTWSELVASGNTERITDGTLRTRLSANVEEQDRVAKTEADWERLLWLLELQALQVRSPLSIVAGSHSPLEALQVLEAVRKDPYLSALLASAVGVRRGQVAIYQDMLARNNLLLRDLAARRAP
jgi:hypothetical protein